MKGAVGLTLAAGLGIVGALSNWFYLQRLARNEEKVYFIAVKKGVTINPGDTIKIENLERVGIPQSGVGNLTNIAPQWSAVESFKNIAANRPLKGGELLLTQDSIGVVYHPLAETLQEDEVVRWVPVDAGAVVPEHINPGDWVSFDVPRIGSAVPTPSGSGRSGSSGGGNASTGMSEIIGPFRIASLGGRREPEYVWDAKRRSSGSESRIAIIVRAPAGQLDAKAARLFEAIRLAGNQGVQVQLHSSRVNAEK